MNRGGVVESLVGAGFRFLLYVMFGLCMEVLFAVQGIDVVLGFRVKRRVPRKYLEGFVSLTMVPLHGFGLLFLFEPGAAAIANWHFGLRFAAYAVGITAMEAAYGWLCHKVIGFYSWDYYADSKYRIFKRGYTLWTLVPMWGVAGMVLEVYAGLVQFLSPYAVRYFLG